MHDLIKERQTQVNYRSTRKNLNEMLRTLQEELIDYSNTKFENPFDIYGLKMMFSVLSNFCIALCFLLLGENRARTQQGYRSLFVYTWFIMLQNYINMRQYDISQLEQYKDI